MPEIVLPAALFKIRTAMLESGERLPLLVDADTGVPTVLPNQYALRVLRPRHEAKTLARDLRDIALLYAAFATLGIDLRERIQANRALADSEIEAVIDFLRIDLQKIAAMELDGVPAVVESSSWRRRLQSARAYLLWLIDDAKSKAELGTMLYQHLLDARNHVDRKFGAAMPKAHQPGRDGLQPALSAKLSEIVRPENAGNPFQKGVRYRNRLIVEGLLVLGPRRGGFLKVRLADVHTGTDPYLVITRERDSVEDPRREEPREKTDARALPLSTELAAMIDDYLRCERMWFPGSKRSPYLLLNRDGTPLGETGINEVLAQLVSWYPEFSGILSPHALRHTAADRYYEILSEKNIDSKKRREILNYLMGWSPTSKQGSRYPRLAIKRAADEISCEVQRRFLAPIGRS